MHVIYAYIICFQHHLSPGITVLRSCLAKHTENKFMFTLSAAHEFFSQFK